MPEGNKSTLSGVGVGSNSRYPYLYPDAMTENSWTYSASGSILTKSFQSMVMRRNTY